MGMIEKKALQAEIERMRAEYFATSALIDNWLESMRDSRRRKENIQQNFAGIPAFRERRKSGANFAVSKAGRDSDGAVAPEV
jgi:hypothetical protein